MSTISKYLNLLKPKSDKVAVFIINYNMPESADSLYEYLVENVKYPIDIYLVDNGSNLVKPSKYTNVWMKKNLQTMGGWLRAFEESDKKPYRYFAYMFLFTSVEFTDKTKDLISIMAQNLKDKKDAVVVIPALSKNSDIYWEHLKNRGGDGLRRTWFIDNIAPLWRADWLDRNGRVNKKLRYAYGVDLEMCWKARKQNKSILINESIEVKKAANIGYKMDRMNMTSKDRERLGLENVEKVMSKKYGKDWIDRMHNEYVKEEWR